MLVSNLLMSTGGASGQLLGGLGQPHKWTSCGLVFQGPKVKKLVYKLQKAGRARAHWPCRDSASAHVHSLIYYQNVFILTHIKYGLYDFLWIEPTNDLA